MSKKRGSSFVTTPIITVCALIILVSFFITIINYTKPFIWFEKLNIVAQKYLYVVERFGTLTPSEKKDLEIDLINKGFDINKIKISTPKENLKYGNLFEFGISYDYIRKDLTFANGILTFKESIVPLKVSKYGYIKYNI